MPRLRRFVFSLASSYAVLVAGVIHTLASVPLALHYLGSEQFGLWALLLQVTTYLALVDLGMSASVSRLLIDHKDKPNDGAYGSLILTGWLVSALQGLVLLVAGLALASPLSDLLDIPAHLQGSFVTLLCWQAAVAAGGFFTRIFHHLLFAHQRFDVTNYAGVASLAVNFAVLWAGFANGWGLAAMVAAGAGGWVAATAINFSACWHWHLFPARNAWGTPSRERFREAFNYSKDVFLVMLGNQILAASPTIIISRALGLEAAAVWAICTKMFNLSCMVVWRIFDMSLPAFSEMYARGEHELLHKRFRDLTALTMSVSGVAAVMLASVNSSFVAIWTQGRIEWSRWNDLLLGIGLLVQALSHCHNGLILITKRIQAMRVIYLAEALVFIPLAAAFASQGGYFWVIACLQGCAIGFSGVYLIRRSMDEFRESASTLLIDWQRPMWTMLAILLPLGALLFLFTEGKTPEVRMMVYLAVCGPSGALLLLRWGIPATLQQEISDRAPAFLRSILKPLFRRQAPGAPAK